MEEAVNEKPRCFNLWKAGSVGLQATTQLRMHPNAQFSRPGVRLRSLLSRKIYLRSADIYCLAEQMQHANQERNQLERCMQTGVRRGSKESFLDGAQ